MNVLSVNDTLYDRSYFDERRAAYERLPLLANSTGRRLAICLEDPAEWLSLCLFLRERGASVAPIHPSTPLSAAQRLAARLDCHVLFYQRLDAPHAVAERGPDEEAVLVQLSSGTTGEPKAIERTWKSVRREVERYVERFDAAASMTPLIACPVTHSYGLISGVLAALSRGVTPVVLTSVNPKYVIRRALETPRSVLYASPTLLNVVVRLLSHAERLPAVMTSGAPLGNAGFEQLVRRCERVFQQYGCSELGCVTLNDDVRAPAELGVPLPHLRVSAGESASAPREIVVHVDGRAVATRDLGYISERGVCFVSRLDDTINVAGINVYPQEVEEAILAFSGIQEAVVYKRADLYAGERVCLQFTAERRIDPHELRAWCAERLSPFQVPLELRQVPAIPRLANGKVSRRALSGDAPEQG